MSNGMPQVTKIVRQCAGKNNRLRTAYYVSPQAGYLLRPNGAYHSQLRATPWV